MLAPPAARPLPTSVEPFIPGLRVPVGMALRATTGPTLSTKSATVGQEVRVSAKVENGGAGPATIGCHVEGLVEGALAKPLPFAFLFEPAGVEVPGKSRKVVSFAWTAALPEGKDAFTFRGKLVLRAMADMKVVGEAPLDLYVRR